MIEVGHKTPEVTFQATSQVEAPLKDYRGKKLILYFYPKDATPGCTTQAQEFSTLFQAFDKLGYVIFGISRDSLSSHEKFKHKYELPFELISDKEEKLCQLFDVIKEKNMYGKKVKGIERSTFIIDEKGIVTHAFRKVKAKGHAAFILSLIEKEKHE